MLLIKNMNLLGRVQNTDRLEARMELVLLGLHCFEVE
jgi:hypothetical protein